MNLFQAGNGVIKTLDDQIRTSHHTCKPTQSGHATKPSPDRFVRNHTPLVEASPTRSVSSSSPMSPVLLGMWRTVCAVPATGVMNGSSTCGGTSHKG